jgi:Bacterial antitoxin of type II TA system, VapB
MLSCFALDVCNLSHMASNLALDDKLLNEALRLGGHRTKKVTFTEALQEYIQRRQQIRAIDLFGQIDFDSSYDYKKHRKKR